MLVFRPGVGDRVRQRAPAVCAALGAERASREGAHGAAGLGVKRTASFPPCAIPQPGCSQAGLSRPVRPGLKARCGELGMAVVCCLFCCWVGACPGGSRSPPWACAALQGAVGSQTRSSGT